MFLTKGVIWEFFNRGFYRGRGVALGAFGPGGNVRLVSERLGLQRLAL